MMEKFKDAPKSLNLKENSQELADAAAEGGISYLVCSSIPVSTLDEIKTAVEVFNNQEKHVKKQVFSLLTTTTPVNLMM
jgi:hypothetical protein